MKKKVKICSNQQCQHRVNTATAAVCVGCGASFRGINWEFLTEEQIEKRLNPEEPEDVVEETKEPETKKEPSFVIICPSCQKHIPYRVGLEFCECGEYVQEEIPIDENAVEEGTSSEGTCETTPAEPIMEQSVCKPQAMRTLDGAYCLTFCREWFKIGRESVGQEYLQSRRKVSREHAILQLVNGAWTISYCKKEDRNYIGGIENPIFINGRRLGRTEQYELQIGDEIAFAELDKSDCNAAFFRVE